MLAPGGGVFFRLGVFIILAVLAIVCCAKSDQKGPLAIERWPEEGVPVIAWTASGDSLPLYSQPGDNRPESYLAVQQNQRFRWDKSLILVTDLGEMEILDRCVLDAFVYEALDNSRLVGGKTATFTFSPGTVLNVVCSSAEGNYIFHHEGKYLEMNGARACQRMLIPPQTQWWVRVRSSNRTSGWVIIDGEKIAVVDRKF